MDALHAMHRFTLLIHGAASGADTLAGAWAIHRGIEVQEFPADWRKLGKRAGPLRNIQMLKEGNPCLVVAFPGGRGTAHMVKIAQAAGLAIISPPTKEGKDMSLESIIEANTAAIIALTVAITAQSTAGVAGAALPTAKPAVPAKPATGGALDYEKDVKPLALRVAKDKKREGLVEILTQFGVAQANLLKPEQYGPFITACNKALGTK